MLTQSGILILPGGDAAPSLEDIALGLGRMPRFAGQTRGWWSVLHHSLVCEILMRGRTDRANGRLAALLHDAHEAVTGDVPTTWKTKDLKARQIELDRRIEERFRYTPVGFRELIRQVDADALRAEGQLVGPPNFLDHVTGGPSPAALYAVTYIRTCYPSPLDTIDPSGRAVQHFKTLVRELCYDRTEAGAEQ